MELSQSQPLAHSRLHFACGYLRARGGAPLAERVAALRRNADPVLALALDAAETEIAAWEHVRAETGYLLSVVRPV